MDHWEKINSYLSPFHVSTDRGGFPDCFFHCIVHWLKESRSLQINVADLRHKIAEYLRTYKYPEDELTAAFDVVLEVQGVKVKSWEHYLELLEQGPLFAGELEINAVANIWGATVYIHSLATDGSHHVQLHGKGADVVSLAFAGNHFRTVDRIGVKTEPVDLFEEEVSALNKELQNLGIKQEPMTPELLNYLQNSQLSHDKFTQMTPQIAFSKLPNLRIAVHFDMRNYVGGTDAQVHTSRFALLSSIFKLLSESNLFFYC